MGELDDLGKRAKDAARGMAVLSTEVKNRALDYMAQALLDRMDSVLEANREDLEEGRRREVTSTLMDRLKLDEGRLEGMAVGLREVAALPDPVGEVVAGWRLPNGLEIR